MRREYERLTAELEKGNAETKTPAESTESSVEPPAEQ